MKVQKLMFSSCYSIYKQKEFGVLIHSSSSTLYSSGFGWVRSIGKSPDFNKFICVVYEDVVTVTGVNIGSVLFRYCNLENVLVKKGKKVLEDTILGTISSDKNHSCFFYLEADKDIRYANYTPALLLKSGDLYPGCRGDKDTTFPISLVLHNL